MADKSPCATPSIASIPVLTPNKMTGNTSGLGSTVAVPPGGPPSDSPCSDIITSVQTVMTEHAVAVDRAVVPPVISPDSTITTTTSSSGTINRASLSLTVRRPSGSTFAPRLGSPDALPADLLLRPIQPLATVTTSGRDDASIRSSGTFTASLPGPDVLQSPRGTTRHASVPDSPTAALRVRFSADLSAYIPSPADESPATTPPPVPVRRTSLTFQDALPLRGPRTSCPALAFAPTPTPNNTPNRPTAGSAESTGSNITPTRRPSWRIALPARMSESEILAEAGEPPCQWDAMWRGGRETEVRPVSPKTLSAGSGVVDDNAAVEDAEQSVCELSNGVAGMDFTMNDENRARRSVPYVRTPYPTDDGVVRQGASVDSYLAVDAGLGGTSKVDTGNTTTITASGASLGLGRPSCMSNRQNLHPSDREHGVIGIDIDQGGVEDEDEYDYVRPEQSLYDNNDEEDEDTTDPSSTFLSHSSTPTAGIPTSNSKSTTSGIAWIDPFTGSRLLSRSFLSSTPSPKSLSTRSSQNVAVNVDNVDNVDAYNAHSHTHPGMPSLSLSISSTPSSRSHSSCTTDSLPRTPLDEVPGSGSGSVSLPADQTSFSQSAMGKGNVPSQSSQSRLASFFGRARALSGAGSTKQHPSSMGGIVVRGQDAKDLEEWGSAGMSKQWSADSQNSQSATEGDGLLV